MKRSEKTESCEKREIRGRYEKKKVKSQKKRAQKKQKKRKRKLNKEFESVEVLG